MAAFALVPFSSVPPVKAIPGFDGYFASADGRIWREMRDPNRAGLWRELGGRLKKGKRYRKVNLQWRGRKVTEAVHRLVLLAWRGPPPSDAHESRHLDGDGLNNAIENLEWSTHVDNVADQLRHGTRLSGDLHPMSRAQRNALMRRRFASNPTLIARFLHVA